jgi:hypothetical protein
MKKFITNLNPFVLLMIPVMVALVLGVNYQFELPEHFAQSNVSQVEHATSLFSKGVHLVKAVCSLSPGKLW